MKATRWRILTGSERL